MHIFIQTTLMKGNILESEKSKRFFYTKNNLPRVLIFSSSNFFLHNLGTVFIFGWIWKTQNSQLSHLLEDHKWWVNLWNIGIWWHALYTSEKALINWLYLCRELSIIYLLYFIHSVHNNLSQVFIKPIGFTVESILKDIISQHCCGLVFCVNF